jgi:hypothetical protein
LTQVQLFTDRCTNPSYWTYPHIREKYEIRLDEAVRHALLRTACGLFWEPGADGGRDPDLSPLDLGKFREIVLEAYKYR